MFASFPCSQSIMTVVLAWSEKMPGPYSFLSESMPGNDNRAEKTYLEQTIRHIRPVQKVGLHLVLRRMILQKPGLGGFHSVLGLNAGAIAFEWEQNR